MLKEIFNCYFSGRTVPPSNCEINSKGSTEEIYCMLKLLT